jgi:hypothetical protein
MESKPLELLQLFNEVSNVPGLYFCSLCGKDTTLDWNNNSSHHVWNRATRQFIPICSHFSLLKQYQTRNNNNIASLESDVGKLYSNGLTSTSFNDIAYRNSLNKVDPYVAGSMLSSIGITNKPSTMIRENYITNDAIIGSNDIANANIGTQGRCFPPQEGSAQSPVPINGDKVTTLMDPHGDIQERKNILPRGHVEFNTHRPSGEKIFPGEGNSMYDRTNTENLENLNGFRENRLLSKSGIATEKEKENVPPLPRGFIRASEYPYDGDINIFPQSGTTRQISSFTSENCDTAHTIVKTEPTRHQIGSSGPFCRKRGHFGSKVFSSDQN